MSVATGTRHLSWERAVVEADGESQRLCNGEYAEERVLLTNVREHAAALCDVRVQSARTHAQYCAHVLHVTARCYTRIR